MHCKKEDEKTVLIWGEEKREGDLVWSLSFQSWGRITYINNDSYEYNLTIEFRINDKLITEIYTSDLTQSVFFKTKDLYLQPMKIVPLQPSYYWLYMIEGDEKPVLTIKKHTEKEFYHYYKDKFIWHMKLENTEEFIEDDG